MPKTRVLFVVMLLVLAVAIPLLTSNFGGGGGVLVTHSEPAFRTIRPSILASGSLPVRLSAV